MQAGSALSSLLPDHVGDDSLRANYSQAFIPGLVTSLRGIRYEPCLLRSSALGAGASAAGVVLNPELFATRPTGAGMLPHSKLHFDSPALAADCGSHESRNARYTYQEVCPESHQCRVMQDAHSAGTLPASHTAPFSGKSPCKSDDPPLSGLGARMRSRKVRAVWGAPPCTGG